MSQQTTALSGNHPIAETVTVWTAAPLPGATEMARSERDRRRYAWMYEDEDIWGSDVVRLRSALDLRLRLARAKDVSERMSGGSAFSWPAVSPAGGGWSAAVAAAQGPGSGRGSAWSAIALVVIAVAAVAAFVVLQVIAQIRHRRAHGAADRDARSVSGWDTLPPGYGVRPLGGRPRVFGSQPGEVAAARRVRSRSLSCFPSSCPPAGYRERSGRFGARRELGS